MRALVLDGVGKALELREVAAPTAGEGEVVVRVVAAAINHRDLWIQKGQYAGLKFPIVLGSDGVGVVHACGPGVDASWTGKAVVLDPSLHWGDDPRAQGREFRILGLPDDGTFAEYVRVPVSQVHARPEHLTDAEAAAIPLAGVTAYRAVVTHGDARPGARVLVTGIGGGVAAFALQLAHARGAEVHVTSSQDGKLERARAHGAAFGANYKHEGWVKELKARAPEGYDLIVDSAGGDGFASLLELARPGGRVVFYGATQGNPKGLDLRRIFWKQLRLQGTTMGTADDFSSMLKLFTDLKLRPAVDRTFPFAAANEAFAHVAAGAQYGKVVLVP